MASKTQTVGIAALAVGSFWGLVELLLTIVRLIRDSGLLH